jgi:hypothetical protein
MKGSLHSDDLLGRPWRAKPVCAAAAGPAMSSSWTSRATTARC